MTINDGIGIEVGRIDGPVRVLLVDVFIVQIVIITSKFLTVDIYFDTGEKILKIKKGKKTATKKEKEVCVCIEINE